MPAGMEQQATWILSRTGQEISGCCIQAATRDFARFGQFVLDGARVDGQPIVAGRLAGRGDTTRTDIGQPGRGYGYQWWTYDDGSFAARGIFGQGIFIDPKRRLVIASNANWAGGARDRAASDGARELLQGGAEGDRRRGCRDAEGRPAALIAATVVPRSYRQGSAGPA